MWFHIVNFSNLDFHILGNCITKHVYLQEFTFNNFIISFKTALKLENVVPLKLATKLIYW